MKFAQVLLLGAITAGVQAVFLRQDASQVQAAIDDLDAGERDMLDKLQDADRSDVERAAKEHLDQDTLDKLADLDEDDLKELKKKLGGKKDKQMLAQEDAVAAVIDDVVAAKEAGASDEEIKKEAKRRAMKYLSKEDQDKLESLSDEELAELKKRAERRLRRREGGDDKEGDRPERPAEDALGQDDVEQAVADAVAAKDAGASDEEIRAEALKRADAHLSDEDKERLARMDKDELRDLFEKAEKKLGDKKEKPAEDALGQDDVEQAVADAVAAKDAGASDKEIRDEAIKRADKHLSDEDKERLAGMSEGELQDLFEKAERKHRRRRGGDKDGEKPERDGEKPEKPAEDALGQDDVADLVDDVREAKEAGASDGEIKKELRRRAKKQLSDEDKEKLASLSDEEIAKLKERAAEKLEARD